MKYVYDLTVNFKPNYLDFFEWNEKDNIKTFRKISIIKISSDDLNNLLSNIVIISQDLLNKIAYKNNYISLFITNSNALVCKFNKKGQCILKSSLVAEEELDILEIHRNMKIMHIDYEIIKICQTSFMTRKEKEMIDFLNNELDKMDLIKDSNKINYLYFECYGQEEKNSKKALLTIKNSLKNHCKLESLYKFFQIIKTI